MRIWLFLASVNGLIAVLAGAYGRHSLAADDGGRQIFNLGVSYHMWHALALLAVAWLADRREGAPPLPVQLAGIAFIAGMVLFSGSLYALAITGSAPVPYAAPVGGVSFMAGWVASIWTAIKER
jgi:uncharacterized membrane protein YgdD (TMEM256/DUF423 family)